MAGVVTNPVPQAILLGIQNNASRPLVNEAEQIPQHLPLILFFAEQGSDEPQIVVGNSMLNTYGANTFDYTKPYANHATVLANTISGAANSFMAKRVIPDDAQTAVLRLSLEIVNANSVGVGGSSQVVNIKQYLRDATTGQYIQNPNGTYIQAAVGAFPTDYTQDSAGNYSPITGHEMATIAGSYYLWHVNYAGQPVYGSSAQPVGQATIATGSVTWNSNSYVSQVYPIADFVVASPGAYGNRTGVRISAPTMISSTPPNLSLEQQVAQFIYRFQAVQQPLSSSTAAVLSTQDGDTSLDLVLGTNIMNPQLNTNLSADNVFAQAYQDLNPTSGPKTIGPFSSLFLYHTNIDAVQTILFNQEAGYIISQIAGSSLPSWISSADQKIFTISDPSGSGTVPNIANKGLMNLLTGVDFNGVPYETIRQGKSSLASFTTFAQNATNTVYAANGSDGTLTIDKFDSLVNDFYSNFGAYVEPVSGKVWPLLDVAKYPISVIYDTGFSPATKLAMLTPVGARKDLRLVLGTHFVGQQVITPGSGNNPATSAWVPRTTQLSVDEEQSYGGALNAVAISGFPESEIYSTPATRISIVEQSGTLINSQYLGLLPLTIDVAYKFARYMGAGTGMWSNGNAPDISPANQVSLLQNINNTWQTATAYATEWQDGLMWVQNYDTRAQFYPAFTTIFPDDTSVLDSMITVAAAVELEKVAQRVWRDLVGRTDLTDPQFIDASNALIVKYTTGRFDNRIIVIPETFYTAADSARGYSWSCNIEMYANNMRLIGVFTIVANRSSDLPAAA